MLINKKSLIKILTIFFIICNIISGCIIIKKQEPTTPKTSEPNATPGPSVNRILAYITKYDNQNDASYSIYVALPSGSQVPTSSMTVAINSTPVAISGTITYNPGTVYEISVTVAGVSHSDSLIAPGGMITISGDGTQVSWEVEGNNDKITVYKNKTSHYIAGPDLTSPYNIPASVYSESGIYDIYVTIRNEKIPAFPSLSIYSNSSFSISEEKSLLNISK